MKRLITLALAALLAGTVSFAQEQGGSFLQDCDIRLSVGGSPTVAADYLTDGSIFRGDAFYYNNSETLSHLYKDYTGPVKTSGAICLAFNYRFTQLLSTGLTLGCTNLWYDNYNGITETVTDRENGTALYLMPYFRVNYVNGKAVRIYMSTSLGAGKYLGFKELKGWRRDYEGIKYWEDKSLKFEAQLTLFGMEIGRGNWFGCFEIGVGTMFNGASIGAGYRF